MQGGMQFMPVVMPMGQMNKMPDGPMPQGAVPMAMSQNGAAPQQVQMAAQQMQMNGAAPNGAMQMPFAGGMLPSNIVPIGLLPPGVVPTAGMGGSGSGGSGFQGGMNGMGSSRPTRGRSPADRGRREPEPAMPVSQDWESLRRPSSPGVRRPRPSPIATAEKGPEGSPPAAERPTGGPRASPFASAKPVDIKEKDNNEEKKPDPPAPQLGNQAQQPWRPANRGGSPLRGDRPGSPEGRAASGDFREGSPAGRMPSPGGARGASPRRGVSPWRGMSPRRGASPMGRRAGSVGRFQASVQQGTQLSNMWPQTLANGEQVTVFLIADPSALETAVRRLGQVTSDTMFALDCQGVDLRAASGRCALLQLAFRDETGVQCFLFDYIQLGETVSQLTPFLTNKYSKIVHDTQTYAGMFAHHYGIKLQGVIDAQWGYETITGHPLYCQNDLLEWCGVAPPGWTDECAKMEKNDMWWLDRPLAQPAVRFAVQGVCSLYHTSPVLWQKLSANFGSTALQKIMSASSQRVEMAYSAGWACRQAGLWVGEHGFPHGTIGQPEPDDPEMDTWLAQRFGERHRPAERAAKRAASVRAHSQEQHLPADAVRECDSPRTASWRAAVASINPEALGPARQPLGRTRSRSPELDDWLSQRTKAKLGGEAVTPRRHRSVPPPKPSGSPQPTTKGASDDTEVGRPMRPFILEERDDRAWAEILADEQAQQESLLGEDLQRMIGK